MAWVYQPDKSRALEGSTCQLCESGLWSLTENYGGHYPGSTGCPCLTRRLPGQMRRWKRFLAELLKESESLLVPSG